MKSRIISVSEIVNDGVVTREYEEISRRSDAQIEDSARVAYPHATTITVKEK